VSRKERRVFEGACGRSATAVCFATKIVHRVAALTPNFSRKAVFTSSKLKRCIRGLTAT
jgi:hypothetical protein